jgi:tRNA pseudouridine38-40 synthase
VGLGRRPPEWIGELLASRDRALGAATFAAEGLYLARVQYDPAWGLAEPLDRSGWDFLAPAGIIAPRP